MVPVSRFPPIAPSAPRALRRRRRRRLLLGVGSEEIFCKRVGFFFFFLWGGGVREAGGGEPSRLYVRREQTRVTSVCDTEPNRAKPCPGGAVEAQPPPRPRLGAQAHGGRAGALPRGRGGAFRALPRPPAERPAPLRSAPLLTEPPRWRPPAPAAPSERFPYRFGARVSTRAPPAPPRGWQGRPLSHGLLGRGNVAEGCQASPAEPGSPARLSLVSGLGRR